MKTKSVHITTHPEIGFASHTALMLRLSMTAMLLSALIVALSSPRAGAAEGRFSVELEAGPVWQSRNNVQIPNNDEGTRFSLVDVARSGPATVWRVYFNWSPGGRHELRALVAPLTIKETGTLDSEIGFAGSTFAPGVPTDATYKFNSYRATYRYRFVDRERWRTWIGFSAKIRDARVAFEQTGVASEDTDIGFVPLLHVRVERDFAEDWRLSLDLDALAGGPGRAEDVALKISRDVGDRLSLSAGYRTLEGGADVDQVYNFAWLHYGVVSARFQF